MVGFLAAPPDPTRESDRPETHRTWAPNSSSMTFRTRFRVQTSPRNPKCFGPFSRSSGSLSVRSSSESFGGRPGRGEVLSAFLPSSRAFFIHWLTAPSLTPRASATGGLFPAVLLQLKGSKTTGFPPVGGGRIHSQSVLRSRTTIRHTGYETLRTNSHVGKRESNVLEAFEAAMLLTRVSAAE